MQLSKEKMSGWLKKTILPELLDIKIREILPVRRFWYATDRLSYQKKNSNKGEKIQLMRMILLNTLMIQFLPMIETELFARIDQLMGLSPNVICYDTTNFFTYIEEPKRSKIANTCHSKDSKNHL